MSGLVSLVEVPLYAVAALFTGYLLLLAAAAVTAEWARRRAVAPARPSALHRFAIVVPARNEAATLPSLLAACRALGYPRPRYEVIVIADHCDDDTAAVALAGGARVLVRRGEGARGKGAALGWAFSRLLAERRHDAFVVLDADTRPEPDFLRRLDARLGRGASAAQGYCGVANPRESWRTALMSADMALNHYLRPAGREALGGSADIHGNGFCLTRAALRQVPWETASVAEDLEYHLRLVLAGLRSAFVPDAVVHTVMEPTMRTARAQELRWEGGHFALARRQVGPLLLAAARRRSWTLFDAALDLATPPLALLATATAAMTGLHALAALGGAPVLPAGLWALLLAGQASHIFAGCALARVPARAYVALFVYGPAYAVAKVWYYALIVTGGARDWVPTPRKAPAVEKTA